MRWFYVIFEDSDLVERCSVCDAANGDVSLIQIKRDD
jgi:hypothetical protein